jgi:hypothetical protein
MIISDLAAGDMIYGIISPIAKGRKNHVYIKNDNDDGVSR